MSQEAESKKRKRRADIRHLMLSSIAAVGLLSVAAIAPQVIGTMARLGFLPGKRQEEIIAASQTRLLRQGLLAYENGSLRLTVAGERTLRALEFKKYRVKAPKRWDGRWRVLIFDIPERRKKVRDQVRRMLWSVGFIRLQDSVWLYPYDCEDLAVLLKGELRIGQDLLYLVVDSLENDIRFRKHFKLPLRRR